MSMIPVTSVAAPHAASHYAGGSDQIAGQSLNGLRTTDSPTFAGLTTTGAATFGGVVSCGAAGGTWGEQLLLNPSGTNSARIAYSASGGYRWTTGITDPTGVAPFTFRYEEGSLDVLTLARNGVATFGGQLLFGASTSYANGSAYTNAINGLTIGLATGSTNDLYIGTPTSGLSVLRVPTGTRNVEFGATTASTSTTTGALVVGGGIGVGGAINAAGSIITAGGSAADVSDAAVRLNNNRILTWLDASGAYTNCGFVFHDTSNNLCLGSENATMVKLSKSGSTDDTALYLYDVTAGSLKRVSRGAADSGGSGYRLLRIAN